MIQSTQLEHRVAERISDLERLNTQLQHVNNTKTLFVSLVAHDLRTPLTAMKGYLENMLIGVFGPLNADYTNVNRTCQHCTLIVIRSSRC